MSGIEWTEQDAREWLAGDCEFVDHRAVLTVVLGELDKFRDWNTNQARSLDGLGRSTGELRQRGDVLADLARREAETVRALEAELVGVRSQLDKVRAIHQPSPFRGWCKECAADWPCSTVVALGGST